MNYKSLTQKINEGFNQVYESKEEEDNIFEAINNYDDMTDLAEQTSEETVLMELEANFGGTKMRKFYKYLKDEGIVYDKINGFRSHFKSEPDSVKDIYQAVISYFSSKELREFMDDFKRLVLDESKE